MNLIFLALILAALIIFALLIRRSFLRGKIIERMQFGMNIAVASSDPNLSAGDYGLTGSARFFYHLSMFLSSNQGYALLFGLGASIAALGNLLIKKSSADLLITAIAGGSLLLLFVTFLLRSRRNQRLNLIKYELPNALEMIAAIMESGLGFEAALGHVIRESDTKHPLYFDLAIMSEAMQRGRRRNEALRLWASRTSEPGVSDVAAGMIQADQTGASLGSVLTHHANTLLRENEAFLMRRAERLPVRMLAPMVLLILPSVLVVAAGPSISRILQIFKDIMERA
jgi:tight adherence protein C